MMPVLSHLRLLAGAGVVLSLLAAAAPAQAPTNAALTYWQAFALMPRLEAKQHRILGELEKVPLDNEAKQLIDSAGSSLKFLHRGAKIAKCDWGLDYDDGINLLLLHLDRGRTLSRLALLRARSRFEGGDPRGGVDDALATIALGRHLAADRMPISYLVQMAIEQSAVEMIARHLPALDPEARRSLIARLDRLPPGGALATSMEAERGFMNWAGKRVNAMAGARPEEFKEKVVALFAPNGFDTDGKRAKELRTVLDGMQGASPAGVLRLLKPLQEYNDELMKLVDVPPEEAVQRINASHERLVKGNPLAIFLSVGPRIIVVWERAWAQKAQLAMLKAAAAGPEALRSHPDAVGNGPFGYRAVPGGFELTSKLKVKDKPVTLRVGSAAR